MRKSAVNALCVSTLILLSACATETSLSDQAWCLKYRPVHCNKGDLNCLSNEAEYMCKCEKKETNPDLYQELCE